MVLKKIQSIVLSGLLIICGFSCGDKVHQSQKEEIIPPAGSNKPDTSDLTNNFYDNAEDHKLPFTNLVVGGEVSNPGPVSFEGLQLHTVIVKETRLSETGDTFTGAYRYDGYSLFDILNNYKIEKKNKEEFAPIIDLYVQIENEKGEKVFVSWGEIYYPNQLHEIIIATSVMRIVPSKTKDLWPLPVESKMIFATDLITERNITSPSKITVISSPKSFTTVKGLSPVFSHDIRIFENEVLFTTLFQIPAEIQQQTFHAIFYGRGRGIHSTQPFDGYMLKEIVKKYSTFNKQFLQTGLILIVAKDGYRGLFTYSEVMNRNDQSEVLLVYKPDEKDGGVFRLFPAGDFFSDRAIKAIESIYISYGELIHDPV
jgi:hypothetical protein